MKIGFADTWDGMGSERVIIIDETLGVDDALRETIEQVIGEQLSILMEKLGCTGGCIHQEINASEMIFISIEQILAYLHSVGKYVCKHAPTRYRSINGTPYDANGLTGLFLKDKTEIKNIKEEG